MILFTPYHVIYEYSQSGRRLCAECWWSHNFNMLSLIVSICICCFLSVSAKQPNILFYVIDDLGWNDTSFQGAEYNTPNLDKLTSEGVRLKQYYVQPVCSPSRSALMAGRYSYNLGLAHGVITNGHPYGLGLDEETLAQQLKNGGYSTHAIGKWDLGMHKWEFTPTYRGFDTFYGYYNAAEDYFTHSCGAQPYKDPNNPAHIIFHPHGVDFRRNKDPVTNQNGSYSTTLFSKEVQSIISEHDSNKGPFFIYAAYQAMHTPLEVPDQYLSSCMSITDPKRKTFCGMIQALDEGVGQTTSLLESKGLIDDTVIILSTDNGGQTAYGSSNWPLRGNKATVFEGGIRGFGFVWDKSIPGNRDSTHLMHITDWFPTVVEGIAGIALEKGLEQKLDGFNMWPAITQDSDSPRTEILHQLDPPRYDGLLPFIGQAAIRVGNWKLILGQPNCSMGQGPEVTGDMCPSGWVHKNQTIEQPPENPSFTWLFDVIEDPTERNNVADAHPDIVAQLTARIEKFNSTHIEQLAPKFDPASDPKNFNGVWTPWMD